MSRIFISYRRQDSDIWAGRLADELREHFPPDLVFQDIASIDPGADFRTVLDEALATAAAMLVVIGPDWLSASDKSGRKRLERPSDLVHREVAEGLRHPGVRVFPLLVNGADMPTEEDLPEPLKPLARRQAFELTVRHWSSDVAQLAQVLKAAPGLAHIRATRDEAAGQIAEQQAKREAEERSAKDEVQRNNEEAKRTSDERARSNAEEDARRDAAIAAQDIVTTPKADEAKEPSVTEQFPTERPKNPETANRFGMATSGTPTSGSGVPTPKSSWKFLATIGALGAVALLVFFSLREPSAPLPNAPSTPSITTDQAVKPSELPGPPTAAPAAQMQGAAASPAASPRKDVSTAPYVRYMRTSCQSISDAKTNLEWFVGPDRNMTWDEAKSWISSLSACGGSWQMPTTKQLATLYDANATAGTGYSKGGRSYPARIDPIFNGIGRGSWVWSRDVNGTETATFYNFHENVKVAYAKYDPTFTIRAFAVKRSQ